MGMALFDDLLQGVQTALMNAQRALLRRGEEAGRAEEAAGEVLRVTVPRADGGPGEETIALPTSGFRVRRNLQVASLSMSFECELRHSFLLALAGACAVVIPEGEGSGAPRRNMRIVFDGGERPAGAAWLDGRLLATVPPVVCASASEAPGAMAETSLPEVPAAETTAGEAASVENAGAQTAAEAASGRAARGTARRPRRSMLQRAAAWLLRHVGASGFLLTPEQTERARRIWKRPVGAAANGPPARPCQQGG